MHLSGSSDPARFELSPYKEPAGTDRNAIRYLKERVAKQQRVIKALQETPMLPTAVLRPPAPSKDKRSRAILEQGQGSYESRKLLEKKRAKREQQAAAVQEKKDKEDAREQKLKHAAREKRAAAAKWLANNRPRKSCQCKTEGGTKCSADGGGHLCMHCGIVKKQPCRTAACMQKAAVLGS